MKKFGILTFPLTANAQTPPKQIPEPIVQEAIKEFINPWCETGYAGLIESVKECFDHIDRYSPDIDKCLLGNIFLDRLSGDIHELSQKTGKPDPTANINYVSEKEYKDRLRYILLKPKFEKIGVNFVAYLTPGKKALIQAFLNTANKCPAH